MNRRRAPSAELDGCGLLDVPHAPIETKFRSAAKCRDVPNRTHPAANGARRSKHPTFVKDYLRISAKSQTVTFQERDDTMTDPDILSRKIHELKDWQSVAWRRIADPLLTTFERREIRNHLKQSDDELRRYLGMMSDRLRFRTGSVENVGDSLAQLKFRLLA
jgi:hypothetical protein